MGNLMSGKFFTFSKLFDLYLILSFASSALLAVGLYYFKNEDLYSNFFTAMLLVTNYFYFAYAKGHGPVLMSGAYIPIYFLTQAVCLVGTSFQLESSSPLYMSIIPILGAMALFVFADKEQKESDKKGIFLMALVLCSFFVFQGVKDTEYITKVEGWMLFSFCMWSFSLLFMSGEYLANRQKNIFSKLVSLRGKSVNKYRHDSSKESYFFHDLVNLTHGLSLFLNSRLNTNNGLNKEECESILSEVRTLQSLVKDYYGNGHKNLQSTYNIVSFDQAREGICQLVDSFLPENKVQCHFLFKGWLSEPARAHECKVHYPSFYRILNNLIKNMAEDHSNVVEFVFDYTNDGLHMIVKNKIMRLKDNRKDLAHNLKEIILEGEYLDKKKERRSGVGLESVTALTNELGGTFEFYIEGEFWVSDVYLPNPEAQPESKVAA